MTRPARLRLLTAVAVLAAGSLASGAGTPARADDVPDDPLQVVIQGVSPSTVPERGPVTVAGTVRNRSTVPWSDLQVYLVTSQAPIVTHADLVTGAALDPSVGVGDRLVDPDLYVGVGDLDPGETTGFRLSVPRDRLGISGRPGVYWLGVQVLGTADGGRDRTADGRARTFLPLVPPRTPSTELALALQLRTHTVRAPDGRLGYLAGWQAALRGDGRLGRVLGFGRSASGYPLTWVVDPAVLDAVRSVGEDNPPLNLDAVPTADGGPADDPGGTTGADDGGTPPEDPSGDAPTREARSAVRWLARFVDATATARVLALPYADLDVAAAVRLGDTDQVRTALGISADLLDKLGVPSEPVLAPPDGRLPADAIAAEPDVPVVLAREAVSTAAEGPVLRRTGGGRVLLHPANQTMWGPGPGTRRSALDVRQRLLADAALHVLSGKAAQPMVRILPAGWDPGPRWRRARFFRGLDVPWLSSRSVADLLGTAKPSGTVDLAHDVRYPPDEVDAELGFGAFASAAGLAAHGRQLDALLTDNNVVDDELARQALLTTSVWSRRRPQLATQRAMEATRLVDSWLGRIAVRAPSFVTMSSGSGAFQVTLVNGLDQPVTVGLRATAPNAQLRLTTPDAIRLPPNGRGAMRIHAAASDIGIHLVTLQPVSGDGSAVGEVTTVSVRSSKVGLILWVVMGVGAAVLLVMVFVRIRQRIRQRRRTHGPLLQRARR